jgi:spore germination protein KB
MENQKSRISAFQLYTLMVLFQLGTSSVFFLGAPAKQDAWMAVILASIIGIVLFSTINMGLFRLFPDYSLAKIIEKGLGKTMGKLLGFIYVAYFLYLAFLILRDTYEIVEVFLLTGTPVIVVLSLTIFVVVYALSKGIENLGRGGELYFWSSIVAYLLIFIFILFSGIIDLNNLFPMFEKGFKPILKATPPLFLAFPFGELLAFSFIYPVVNKKNRVHKVGVLSIITSATILVITTLFIILVEGALIANHKAFPTISMIRMINVGEFIQRLDAITVLIYLVGSMTKLCIYLYAANAGLQDVFNTKNYKIFLLPTGIITIAGAILIADSYLEHMNIGLKIVPYYINLPFEIIIPSLIIIIILIERLIKKLLHKEKSNKSNQTNSSY